MGSDSQSLCSETQKDHSGKRIKKPWGKPSSYICKCLSIPFLFCLKDYLKEKNKKNNRRKKKGSMGQAVSCLFGSICGEAEKEESLSDPNLQTCPLIAPPKSVSCIGSSADGAIHQFMVYDSANEVVEDKRKFYPSRYNYCSDLSSNEALQQHLLTAPPTVVLSINSSSNEALQHDQILPTPTIYSSTNDTYDHDLVIAPSTVVPSIGSSTSEVLHQIDVIDSIIEGLEDKRRIYQQTDDLKSQEPREVDEKEVEKLCIQVVGQERKINHYSSSQKILLVGEGDFSFSACLAVVFGSASNMVATSLDSEEFLHKNYKKAKSNICKLRSRGCMVMHGMDATEMADNFLLNSLKFDRIIYNFPLAGFFPDASRKSQLKRNRRLILKFLENAKKLILEHGEIHITHKSWGFFHEWNLQLLASNVGLRLIEETPFNFKDYEGYNTKCGFGGDKFFNCNPSKTYIIGLKLRKPG